MREFLLKIFRGESKHQFLLESVFLWIVICAPVNLISLWYGLSAPPYSHIPRNCTSNETAIPEEGCCTSSFIAHNSSDIYSRNKESNLMSTSNSENGSVGQYDSPFGTVQCYDQISDVEDMLNMFEFWVSGVCLLTVGLAGFVGNLLTIWVLSFGEEESRRKNSFNRLLVYMAVVDLLLIATCITEYSILNVFVGKQPQWYLRAFPYFLHPAKHTLLSMCIFAMVAISLERCQAICHPLRPRPSPFAYMATVLVISITLNGRKFFELRLAEDGSDYETTSLMEYAPYLVFSNVWQELIVTGVVPFLGLLYYNGRIYGKIRESTRHECHRFVGKSSEGQDLACSTKLRKDQPNQSTKKYRRPMNDNEQSKAYSPGSPGTSFVTSSFIRRTDSSQLEDRSFQRLRRMETERFNIIQKADPGYPTMRSTLGSSVLVKISRPNDCGSTSPLPLQNLSEGQKKLRKRHEKTVIILILIVLVFLICHSFRLGVQTYQTVHSHQSLKDHFDFCLKQNRLSYPAVFVILVSFNNLFLVFNSSINFVIYCVIRKLFRKCVIKLLRAIVCLKNDDTKTNFPRSSVMH